MAQIAEEVIVVKLSKLVKDGQSSGFEFTEELAVQLEAVLGELVGDGFVVEVFPG